MVNRSALVLKLLTDSRYGSLVAAPTFGLPEAIGGPRNWDYRYTWLRDSSFSLYALMRLGYTEEGRRFNEWLKGRLRFDRAEGPLQVMYGIDGRAELPEYELAHLSRDTAAPNLCVSATRRSASCSSTSTGKCSMLSIFRANMAMRHPTKVGRE